MTNAQIIFNESIRLFEEGIIKGTGRMLEAVITDKDGNEEKKLIEEPEAIHTYATWKQLGRQVMKGQKAKAEIVIRKHTEVQKKDSEEEEKESKMFMKKAFFFTLDQTEAIA